MAFSALIGDVGLKILRHGASWVTKNTDWGKRLAPLTQLAEVSQTNSGEMNTQVIAANEFASRTNTAINNELAPDDPVPALRPPPVAQPSDLPNWLRYITPKIRRGMNYMRKELGEPHAALRAANPRTGDSVMKTLDLASVEWDVSAMDDAAAAHPTIASATMKFGKAVALLDAAGLSKEGAVSNREIAAVTGSHGDKAAIASQALGLARVSILKSISETRTHRTIDTRGAKIPDETRWNQLAGERVQTHMMSFGPGFAVDRDGFSAVVAANPGPFNPLWLDLARDPATFDTAEIEASTTHIARGVMYTNEYDASATCWFAKLDLALSAPSNPILPGTSWVVFAVDDVDGILTVTGRSVNTFMVERIQSVSSLTMYFDVQQKTGASNSNHTRFYFTSTSPHVGTMYAKISVASGVPRHDLAAVAQNVTFRRYSSPDLVEMITPSLKFCDLMGQLAPRTPDDNPIYSVGSQWLGVIRDYATVWNTAFRLLEENDTEDISIEKYRVKLADPALTFADFYPIQDWMYYKPDSVWLSITPAVRCEVIEMMLGDLLSFHAALGNVESMARKFLEMLGLPFAPIQDPYYGLD